MGPLLPKCRLKVFFSLVHAILIYSQNYCIWILILSLGGKCKNKFKSLMTLNSDVSHSDSWMQRCNPYTPSPLSLPVFGTIPSISIPLANFGIELTSHSNSTLGIGAATPIPTQRNWGGFHWDSNFKISSSLMPY